VERVTAVLTDHEGVAELLDNGWLSLTVVDPTQDHRAFRYERGANWRPMDESASGERAEPVAPAVADD
jgi:hypothetical protein